MKKFVYFLCVFSLWGCAKRLHNYSEKCDNKKVKINIDLVQSKTPIDTHGLILLSGFNDSLKIYLDNKNIENRFYKDQLSADYSHVIPLKNVNHKPAKLSIREVNNRSEERRVGKEC